MRAVARSSAAVAWEGGGGRQYHDRIGVLGISPLFDRPATPCISGSAMPGCAGRVDDRGRRERGRTTAGCRRQVRNFCRFVGLASSRLRHRVARQSSRQTLLRSEKHGGRGPCGCMLAKVRKAGSRAARAHGGVDRDGQPGQQRARQAPALRVQGARRLQVSLY